MEPILVCRDNNDLLTVLRGSSVPIKQSASASEAIEEADEGAGILILADGYPETPTELAAEGFEKAAAKKQRLYVEFPASLPNIECGKQRTARIERAVVASDAFAPELEKLRILMVHACRFIEVNTEDAHIRMARVAGFDRALYGLPEETFPLLFEPPGGNVLVATTKLSQFVTGRYAPADAWRTVWQWILEWATGDSAESFALKWVPSVRPTLSRSDSLSSDAEAQAVRRGTDWFRNARLFIHPDRQEEVKRRQDEYNDFTGPGPDKDWPVGDGGCGMLEGAASAIHPDGTQDWRYMVRNDCMGEASMGMAFGGKMDDDSVKKSVAANLNDFIFFNSDLAAGPRADPTSPSYGLVRWYSGDDKGGIYYGDDNARSMMGTMAVAALLEEDRWDEPLMRCLLANLRTTGPLGFRSGRLDDEKLQEKGWLHFWETERTNFAPHYESWLWACFFWAFSRTGFQPFLERGRLAVKKTMAVYPNEWRWTNGLQQERARMLLPLAWLIRVDDTEEHRSWLRTLTQDLLKHQDVSGAIREEVGEAGKGSYGPPKTNEDYATTEAPLIQENGDPLCDLLYTTNFAFAGLHEAAASTGDAFYIEVENQLADFLCRIQVRSEAHPELDGAWFRAFDFGRWDYWASNADWAWGAWCVESGWTQAWIASVLAMRRMKTSLWDLTAQSQIRKHLAAQVSVMLPSP